MSLYTNIGKDIETLHLLLPGASQGPNVGILKFVSDRLKSTGKTYLAVSFPFQDKGHDSPESQAFNAEIAEVMRGLKHIESEVSPKRMVIIGKSFGALVGAKMLPILKENYSAEIEFHVLGYIFDEGLSPIAQAEKVFVYQGEFDRFGTPEQVREKLPNAKVFSIQGADHSYRNDKKEPVFEVEVLNLLSVNLSL